MASEEKVLQRPKIADLPSYRSVLEAMFNYKHGRNPGFSWRRFAAVAGMKSPNYLQLVVQGKKNLSPDAARGVAKVCDFSEAETAYFLALLKWETADSPGDVPDLEKAVLGARVNLKMQAVSRAQAQVLTEWVHNVVSEMVHLPSFEPSGEWVSRKLHGVVTSAEAEAAVDSLVSAGLVHKDEQGRLCASQPAVLVNAKLNPEAMRAFQCENLRKLSEIAPRISREHSTFTTVNVSIRASDLPRLVEQVREMARNVSGVVAASADPCPDTVVQFGCFLLPLLRSD